MPRLNRAGAGKYSGSSLVEVAVALVLISTASVGLAGLQIAGKRTGFDALQRSEATALANDILERIHANSSEYANYASAGLGAAARSEPTAPAADCSARACNSRELRIWDLWQWERALNGLNSGAGAGGLYRPTGCIEILGRTIRVSIAWQGHRPGTDVAEVGGCGSGNYGAAETQRQWLELFSYIGVEA